MEFYIFCPSIPTGIGVLNDNRDNMSLMADSKWSRAWDVPIQPFARGSTSTGHLCNDKGWLTSEL